MVIKLELGDHKEFKLGNEVLRTKDTLEDTVYISLN